MNEPGSADPPGVSLPERRLDALVVALGLSILALCSWPVRRTSAPSATLMAWALLPPSTTVP